MFNAILISVAVVVMMIIVYAVLRSRRLLIKNPSIVFYDVTGVTFSSEMVLIDAMFYSFMPIFLPMEK